MDYGGEDSFFVSDIGGGAFGIADGVGGWQESGINPAGAHVCVATPTGCRPAACRPHEGDDRPWLRQAGPGHTSRTCCQALHFSMMLCRGRRKHSSMSSNTTRGDSLPTEHHEHIAVWLSIADDGKHGT